ncbi:S-layer homology domain-containing protein [Clostridia bacterium]|nr:S-layer homology domain-containing protein [Clostridia bacterium]
MKKSNKILSVVIALIFLFAAVTPAFALSDKADDAANRLLGLGIIDGYEDGSLGTDQTITRAEMCVILAELSGMGSAADILKDVPSTFSDVKTSVWYTGYINLAQTQNWISGYPDGSFRPNADVTYGEAITMILNVLGYGKGDLPGAWPLNYIVKASALDITDDVTFTSGAAALRGDIFVFASAALDLNTVSWNSDDSEFNEDDDTLLDGLGFEVIEDVIIDDAFVVLGSSLDIEDREISTNDSDIDTVAVGFNVRDYIGVMCDFYVDDDTIVAVDDMADVEMLNIDSFDALDELVFDDDDDEYDAEGAVLIVNDEIISYSLDYVPGPLADGFDNVRIAFGDDDNVTLIDVTDYDYMASMLIDEVDFDDEFAELMEKDGADDGSLLVNTDDDRVVVYGVDSLEDIEEWDVVYWNEVDNNSDSDIDQDIAIYVVRDMVEGEMTRFSSDDVKVNGTTYDLGANVWFYSEDNGAEFSDGTSEDVLTLFEDFSDEDVALMLDGFGNVYAISGDIDGSSSASDVGVATGEIEAAFGGFEDEYRIELFLATGEIATYYIEDGDVEINFEGSLDGIVSDIYDNSVSKGDIVEFSLNDDGEIDSIDMFSQGLISASDIDDDYSRIDEDKVVSGTLFFDISESDSDDWMMTDWSDVADADFGTGSIGYTVVDDGDIDYVVLTDALTVTDGIYAGFLDSWKSGSDYYVELITESGVASYVYNEDVLVSSSLENAIFEYDMSGDDVDSLTIVTEYVYGQLPSGAVNSDNTIDIGEWDARNVNNENYDFLLDDGDIDALIIDLTDGGEVISADDLNTSDYVIVVLDDDYKIVVLAVVDQDILDDLMDVSGLYFYAPATPMLP